MKITNSEGKTIWTGEFDHDKAFDFENFKAKAEINEEMGTVDIQYNDDSLTKAVNNAMSAYLKEICGEVDLNEEKTKLFISIEPNGSEYSLTVSAFAKSDGEQYEDAPTLKVELSDDETIDLLESYLYYKIAA